MYGNHFSLRSENQTEISHDITRKIVHIKKRAGSSPIFFHQPSPHFIVSFLEFYLLDQQTISGVDLLEMTWIEGLVVLCHYYGHLLVL